MNFKLPQLKEFDFKGREVLLRADIDVGKNFGGIERLELLIPTLEYLADKGAKIILLGHRGRPNGKHVDSLSMEPVGVKLGEVLSEKWGEDKVEKLVLNVMENLRFEKGEEENDMAYARKIAEHGEVYVNEAFASSHREHASIVTIPKMLPHYCGIRFCEEVENLEKVLNNPKRPVVILISGAKEGKLKYLKEFQKFADKVLLGGKLPMFMRNKNSNEKLFISKLIPSGLDIDEESIKTYQKTIEKAGTIVVSGPLGKFEDDNSDSGTSKVFETVANSNGFKLAGGGDTRHAITNLGLVQKFDWISAGGGSMLEFLAKGTLPGIEALLN